jgi:hypothetical protein
MNTTLRVRSHYSIVHASNYRPASKVPPLSPRLEFPCQFATGRATAILNQPYLLHHITCGDGLLFSKGFAAIRSVVGRSTSVTAARILLWGVIHLLSQRRPPPLKIARCMEEPYSEPLRTCSTLFRVTRGADLVAPTSRPSLSLLPPQNTHKVQDRAIYLATPRSRLTKSYHSVQSQDPHPH